MKTPILCIVSKNINNLENLPRYLGLLKDPLTLFSSIYTCEPRTVKRYLSITAMNESNIIWLK